MSSKNNKYEKKFDENGVLRTTKVEDKPSFEMPTEVKDPGFIPESRILVCTIIPYADGDVVDASGIAPGHKEEFVIEKKSESGLILAATKRKEKAPLAIVNAVGSEVRGYEPGDLIMYKPNPQSNFGVEINGDFYLLMEQYNVLGKYTK